jgi:hypothetical protein
VTATIRSPWRAVPIVLVVVLLGCSSDDDPTGSAGGSAPPESSSAPAGSPSVATTVPPIPTVAPGVSLTVGPTFVTVPDTGVPGLDSDDAFCAAWSEFGGSWQVMVQAAFAGTHPVGRLEVIAAPVVTEAYEAVFAAWPPELESERDVVAEAYFGAFQRRGEAALAALAEAGADDDAMAELATAWRQALAGYDPTTASLPLDLRDDVAALVDTATGGFEDARVPLVDDPSMVITVETPLTDSFLATACPDQGWIVGQDVVGDASSET